MSYEFEELLGAPVLREFWTSGSDPVLQTLEICQEALDELREQDAKAILAYLNVRYKNEV
jgi:hypothetical protein